MNSKIYTENLKILKSRYRQFFDIIEDFEIDYESFKVVPSKLDLPTLLCSIYNENNDICEEFYLHSQYSPQKAAQQFAQKYKNSLNKNFLLYGLGLGYHVKELLKVLNSNQNIIVCDFNLSIFKLALQNIDLTDVLSDDRVKIIFPENNNHFLKEKIDEIIIYRPSLRTIPKKYENIVFFLENYDMISKTANSNRDLLLDNHNKNIEINYPNINKLFNKFTNIPIIVVSAGPSLNKNKELLKDIKHNSIIIAAGSALKSLLSVGVKPDLFCIIDPHPITYKQIEGIEDENIPLVFLSTASNYTISKYNGPKCIVYNDSNIAPEGEQCIETGGSVATAILDMAIKMGGNPIIFVGQDLAYTNNEHHAYGNMYGGDEKINSNINMRKVKGQNGEILKTTLFLLSFKNWIEKRIRKEQNILFINATEGGVHIDGCKHMPLKEVISQILYKFSHKDKREFLEKLKTLRVQ